MKKNKIKRLDAKNMKAIKGGNDIVIDDIVILPHSERDIVIEDIIITSVAMTPTVGRI